MEDGDNYTRLNLFQRIRVMYFIFKNSTYIQGIPDQVFGMRSRDEMFYVTEKQLNLFLELKMGLFYWIDCRTWLRQDPWFNIVPLKFHSACGEKIITTFDTYDRDGFYSSSSFNCHKCRKNIPVSKNSVIEREYIFLNTSNSIGVELLLMLFYFLEVLQIKKFLLIYIFLIVLILWTIIS